jgi:hypothetical protein
MVEKIKAAIQNLTDRLTARKADVGKSRRRAKHFRALAEAEHAAQLRAEANGRPRRAARHRRRAEARQAKAIYWKGRVKADLAATTDLQERLDKRLAEADKWAAANKVHFEGENKVVGGSKRKRLRAALHRAASNYRAGTQPGYYSQEGAARAYSHGLYHYPGGHIWDCSTFGDGIYLCAGVEAPSGPNTRVNGGWTGTMGEHGREIPESQADTGDLVLYGPFPHHHVEVVDDASAKTTIGHGSPPIDPGVFDLFGDGDYIIRRYI